MRRPGCLRPAVSDQLQPGSPLDLEEGLPRAGRPALRSWAEAPRGALSLLMTGTDIIRGAEHDSLRCKPGTGSPDPNLTHPSEVPR
jgi:hypothetical protein